ncbi:MAG: glutathione S-transferase family protein [Acidobacteriota bacterium]
MDQLAVRRLTVRLFHDPISGNCYKVRLALAQLDREVELVPISVREPRPPELLALSPTGRVPLLVLDDGRPLSESNAILCYLAEGSPLLPDDPHDRAVVMSWLFFEQNLHEPYIACRRFWVAYAEDPSQRADQLEFWLKGGNAALKKMNDWLEEHEFFGPAYSIADIALYGYTHVAEEGGFQPRKHHALAAWLDRVAARPDHVAMLT